MISEVGAGVACDWSEGAAPARNRATPRTAKAPTLRDFTPKALLFLLPRNSQPSPGGFYRRRANLYSIPPRFPCIPSVRHYHSTANKTFLGFKQYEIRFENKVRNKLRFLCVGPNRIVIQYKRWRDRRTSIRQSNPESDFRIGSSGRPRAPNACCRKRLAGDWRAHGARV